jgi:hypothetical protein
VCGFRGRPCHGGLQMRIWRFLGSFFHNLTSPGRQNVVGFRGIVASIPKDVGRLCFAGFDFEFLIAA